MKEIASAVGVSRTTVSIVLSGRHSETVRIPEETRTRVLDVARELGYRPNGLARAVASGKTYMLGYLVTSPRYEPYWQTIVGAMNEAEANGYTLKVLRVQPENLQERLRQCLEMRLGGLIVRYDETAGREAIAREAARYDLPLVFVDDGEPHQCGGRVVADDSIGCRMAVEHLVELGHRRIAFFSMPILHGGCVAGGVVGIRERAFLQEMEKRGLEVHPGLIGRDATDHATEGAVANSVNIQDYPVIEETRRLLQLPEGRPTAIFCHSDITAMGVVRACREEGLRVPQDVSVVGFSNFFASRWFDPPLTTVASPWDEMGRRSVRHLLDQVTSAEAPPQETISAPRDARTDLIAPSFLVRRSTASCSG